MRERKREIERQSERQTDRDIEIERESGEHISISMNF